MAETCVDFTSVLLSEETAQTVDGWGSAADMVLFAANVEQPKVCDVSTDPEAVDERASGLLIAGAESIGVAEERKPHGVLSTVATLTSLAVVAAVAMGWGNPKPNKVQQRAIDAHAAVEQAKRRGASPKGS